MKWFQHQSRANSDAKLKKVLMKYGFQGYGLYWYCIENICDNLEPNLTFDLENDSEILGHEGKTDTRLVEEMMLYMVNIGLFDGSHGIITCHKLARYLGTSSTWNNELKNIIKAAKPVAITKSSQRISDNLVNSVPKEKRREEKIKDLSDGSDDCREAFDYWIKVMAKNPSQVKFSPERARKINQRLNDYSVQDIKRGIDGCKKSPHHMGENSSKTKYNDIELICRNSSKLEGFMEMATTSRVNANPRAVGSMRQGIDYE